MITNNVKATLLLSTIKSVIEEDSTQARKNSFLAIVERNFLIKLVYNFHKSIHPSPFSSLMIACFGLKSFFCFRIINNSDRPILFTNEFSNELKTLNLVRECIGESEVSRVSKGLRSLLSFQTLRLIIELFCKHCGDIRSYLRIVRHIDRRNDFMPSCRAVSSLCYYLRFSHEFNCKKYRSVLVAKNYSPDCIALTNVAKRKSIPSIFLPHSFIPPVISKKSDLSYSLLLLQGKKMHEILLSQRSIEGKVVYRGLTSNSSPLNLEVLKSAGMSVGIFLSGMVNSRGVQDTVSRIEKELQPKKIFIRQHPVRLVNEDLSPYFLDNTLVEFSEGIDLEEDVQRCDLIVGGASGVLIEVLQMGKPCVYFDTLEEIPYDYNGFVASGVVLDQTDELLDIEKIHQFYASNWKSKFLDYDHFYEKSASSRELIREEIGLLQDI